MVENGSKDFCQKVCVWWGVGGKSDKNVLHMQFSYSHLACCLHRDGRGDRGVNVLFVFNVLINDDMYNYILL